MLSFLILCLLSCAISILVHLRLKKYIFACLVSGFLSSIIFQIIGFFVMGYLDPFYLWAFAGGTVVAFLIALIVGIPIEHRRKKRRTTTEDG